MLFLCMCMQTCAKTHPPVVPLVYMIVQRSSALGRDGGSTGDSFPWATNSSQEWTAKPCSSSD